MAAPKEHMNDEFKNTYKLERIQNDTCAWCILNFLHLE